LHRKETVERHSLQRISLPDVDKASTGARRGEEDWSAASVIAQRAKFGRFTPGEVKNYQHPRWDYWPVGGVLFGTRGFRTAAPTVWNSLPANVRSCTTLPTFRRHLKSHIFSPASPLPSDPSQSRAGTNW